MGFKTIKKSSAPDLVARQILKQIENHTLYVYGKATSQVIVAAEVLLKGSFAVGVNKNSHLVTMHGTGVALPSFIPEGDLVSIITVE